MARVPIQHELFRAIDHGDADHVRALIAEGADVNFRGDDPEGETPLVRAATAGRLSVVRLLIESGADVNCVGRLNGWTPLMFARTDPGIMRELIAAGADVNARTVIQELVSPTSGKGIRRGGETALHLAAAANNSDAVRFLVQAGAEVETRDVNGLAPLDVALRTGSPTESAMALVEAGARMTPERLEAMHSGAHPPHSDLCFFPEAGLLPPLQTKSEINARSDVQVTSTGAAKTEIREFKCPECGGLVYSRKARLCGNCGAKLSPEVVLSDDQRQLMDEQRQWARDLANAFGVADAGVKSHECARRPAGENTDYGDSWPAQLVRRASCAEEFRHRDRPDFYLYLVGYGLLLAIFVYSLNATGGLSPMVLVILASFFIFACLMAWRRATPICPNCKQNIRICTPVFCHVCGKPLRTDRCAECGVDHSWSSFVIPYAKTGNYRAISYCPNCGAWLDAKIGRWRAGRL